MDATRPGATALSLLSVPLNVHILQALEDQDLPLADLSRAVGHPPPSTLRSYLRTLTELEVLERRREPGFPGGVSYVLGPAGSGLLSVAEVLQQWLRTDPEGPAALGSLAAKSVIKALVEGWCARIVRALAARPLTLTDLDRVIPQISYPTLERRLTAMRRVGQVTAEPGGGARGTPYGATQSLRLAVTPLSAAIAWERRYLPEQTPPIGRLDVEAAFLLALPLIDLPEDVTGVCCLAVEMRNGHETAYAGAMAAVKEGRLISCVTRLGGEADARLIGRPADWISWAKGNEDSLEVGGDNTMARILGEGLRGVLLSGDRV